MIVRVVSYAARDLKAAKRWMRNHEATVRGIPEVRDVHLIIRDDPPQVGSIQIFESREGLRRYRAGEVYSRLLESLDRSGAFRKEPIFDETFEVVEPVET